MNTLYTAATRMTIAFLNRCADLDVRRDRGSGVVETIIIVAGFAGLAFTVYLAVAGKVNGWISKIPGSSGP
ncbi:hypothetical protein [Actinomadura bangladeshensis]|uniref:Uncharacterized protein n=1 Tax=Actinomadura bangladeshensis TaxID=453573 RepID=A0A4R4NLI4_9ACTN|nr:hypothetical protein [Actinomadura bangladeshensis]TDC10288.1 hypothetical protein E1284_28250 [Actinomadura bangladeshensis]